MIDCKLSGIYEFIEHTHKNKSANDYLVDTNSNVICFGNRITIDTYDLNLESDIYSELLANMISNSRDTYEVFCRLKEYYREIKKECRRSGL